MFDSQNSLVHIVIDVRLKRWFSVENKPQVFSCTPGTKYRTPNAERLRRGG